MSRIVVRPQQPSPFEVQWDLPATPGRNRLGFSLRPAAPAPPVERASWLTLALTLGLFGAVEASFFAVVPAFAKMVTWTGLTPWPSTEVLFGLADLARTPLGIAVFVVAVAAGLVGFVRARSSRAVRHTLVAANLLGLALLAFTVFALFVAVMPRGFQKL